MSKEKMRGTGRKGIEAGGTPPAENGIMKTNNCAHLWLWPEGGRGRGDKKRGRRSSPGHTPTNTRTVMRGPKTVLLFLVALALALSASAFHRRNAL